MSRPIAILYEDERGEVRDFPMHTLIVQAIADRLGQTANDLNASFQAIPKKGDAKLLRACEREVPRMPHPVIVAIFDADKVHRLLQQPRDTDRRQLLQLLCDRCVDPRLHILLLEENTESLVAAAATCLGRPEPDRKSKTNRDKILAAAAWGALEVRDCVRAALPSFAALVDALAKLCRPDTEPNPAALD